MDALQRALAQAQALREKRGIKASSSPTSSSGSSSPATTAASSPSAPAEKPKVAVSSQKLGQAEPTTASSNVKPLSTPEATEPGQTPGRAEDSTPSTTTSPDMKPLTTPEVASADAFEQFLLGGGNEASPTGCSSPPSTLVPVTPNDKKGLLQPQTVNTDSSGKENHDISYLQSISAGNNSPVPNLLLDSPLVVNTASSSSDNFGDSEVDGGPLTRETDSHLMLTPKASNVGPVWSLAREKQYQQQQVQSGSKSVTAARPLTGRQNSSNSSSSSSFASASKANSLKTRPASSTTPGGNATLTYSPFEKTLKPHVAVRVRPFLPSEMQGESRRVLSMQEGTSQIQIVNPYIFDADREAVAAAAAAVDKKHWAQHFKFPSCLWSFDASLERMEDRDIDGVEKAVTQEGVFRALGQDMVKNVLAGTSSLCFAYGHAGTGKTYSLFGDLDCRAGERQDGNLPAGAGLVPRAMCALLQQLQAREDAGQDTKATLSFLEIYNEKIRDLLSDVDPGAEGALRLREHPTNGPYVEGLSKIPIGSAADILPLLQLGASRRTTQHGSSSSSRSHAIVTLELSPTTTYSACSPAAAIRSIAARLGTASSLRMSLTGSVSLSSSGVDVQEQQSLKLQFADLAGSYMETAPSSSSSSSSSSNNSTSSGRESNGAGMSAVEKAELKMIRRSLSTLSYIIKALGRGTAAKTLPFRDSALTWILRDALSGKYHTAMLATLSPADGSYDETLNTLKFASEVCGAKNEGDRQVRQDRTGEKRLRESLAGTTPAQTPTHLDVMSRDASDQDDAIYFNPSASTEIVNPAQALFPGVAARQLLKETISDPQQKMAKQIAGAAAAALNARRQISSEPTPTSAQKPYAILGDAATNTTSIETLRNHYRDLYGRYVEMQIELETAKTDRDSMMLELGTTREAIEYARRNVGTKDANSGKGGYTDLASALQATERDLAELKGILVRKEEAVDSLLEDLKDEKQARAIAEHALEVQSHEYAARLSRMQAHVNELEEDLGNARRSSTSNEQQHGVAQSQAETLERRCEHMTATIARLEVELRKERANAQDAAMELVTSSSSGRSTESSLRELNRLAERFRADLSIVTSERDALKRLSETQEAALISQTKQTEASLKVLQDRQQSLEKVEQHNAPLFADIARAQDGLQALLAREGTALHAELLDAQQLTAMLASLRERMNDAATNQQALQRRIEEEVQLRKELEDSLHSEQVKTAQAEATISLQKEQFREYQAAQARLQSLQQQSSYSTPSLTSSSPREADMQRALQRKLAEQIAATKDAEARSQYWQQVSQRASEMSQDATQGSTQQMQEATAALRAEQAEKAKLQQQLDEALSRAELARVQAPVLAGAQAQQQLARDRDEMRLRERERDEKHKSEIAALWSTVEELNTMDVSKERMIRELVGEKEAALSQLAIVKEDYYGLQKELEDIDSDLLEAAQAEGVTFSTPSIASKLREWQTRERSKSRNHSNGSSMQASYASATAASAAKRETREERMVGQGQGQGQRQTNVGRHMWGDILGTGSKQPHTPAVSTPMHSATNFSNYKTPASSSYSYGGGPEAPYSSHTTSHQSSKRKPLVSSVEEETALAEAVLEQQLREIDNFIQGSDNKRLIDSSRGGRK